MDLSNEFCVCSDSFNTMVDIKLRQWAEQALPAKSVESGWEALQAEFNELMQKAKKLPDHDNVFDSLKSSVVDESIKRHTWEDKVRIELFSLCLNFMVIFQQAIDMLRVIQLNTLEDRSVHDKQEWDQAVKFFESSVKDKLAHTEQTLDEMMGPSTTQKWLHWTSSTEDQGRRKWVKSELDKIIQSDSVSLALHSVASCELI